MLLRHADHPGRAVRLAYCLNLHPGETPETVRAIEDWLVKVGVDDFDCNAQLICCTDDKNCGGGMCTLECDNDSDCPSDMLCEHDVCFYMCDSDADCAPEMSCEHGNTICEYD